MARPGEPDVAGHEFALPGCGASIVAVVLFGLPVIVLFPTVILGFGYGAGGPLLLLYALLQLLAIPFIGWGLTHESLPKSGAAYATTAVACALVGNLIW